MKEFADQIPYATALALNETIKQVQAAEREHMMKVFNLRRKSWALNAVKIKPFAKKTSLSTTLRISPAGNNDVFSKFEHAGTKTAIQGRNVAIPTENIRKSPNQVITKAKKPSNLRNSFRVHGRSGKDFIFQTQGKGRARTAKLAYVLQPSVPIDDRLEFEKTAIRVIRQNWNRNFNQAFTKAVSTRNG